MKKNVMIPIFIVVVLIIVGIDIIDDKGIYQTESVTYQNSIDNVLLEDTLEISQLSGQELIGLAQNAQVCVYTEKDIDYIASTSVYKYLGSSEEKHYFMLKQEYGSNK